MAALGTLEKYACIRLPLTAYADLDLDRDISAVSLEMEVIIRRRPVWRFLRAKRHSAQLAGLMKRLDQADRSFNVRTLLTLGARD